MSILNRLAPLLKLLGRDTPTICKLHQCNMQEDVVPVKYGLRRLKEPYIKAKKEQFPNSNLEAFGGCYVSDAFPKETKVRYCEQCRAAELAWHDPES